jgi:hypothetical protein
MSDSIFGRFPLQVQTDSSIPPGMLGVKLNGRMELHVYDPAAIRDHVESLEAELQSARSALRAAQEAYQSERRYHEELRRLHEEMLRMFALVVDLQCGGYVEFSRELLERRHPDVTLEVHDDPVEPKRTLRTRPPGVREWGIAKATDGQREIYRDLVEGDL